MAKGKGGRPRKDEGDNGTRQVRVFEDIAAMLADLALVHPKSTAQLCDPLLRPEITELHKKYKLQIDAAKAAQAEAQRAIEQARSEAVQIASEQQSRKPKRGS